MNFDLCLLLQDFRTIVNSGAKENNSLLVPIISSSIVVLVFVGTTIINYLIRKWDRRRGWYMKALIEPNISVITQFYEDTNKQIKEGVKQIQSTTENLYLVQAKINENFQNLKRKLELDLIQIVEASYDFKEKNRLYTPIYQLEDLFVTFFDKKDFNENALIIVENQISINRSDLLK